MAVVKSRQQDIDMLARLLRAEAEAEGERACSMLEQLALTESERIVPISQESGPFPK